MNEVLISIEDNLIVKRVLDGDVDAFEVIVNKYQKLVFSMIVKNIPKQDVEEVAQEAFIRVYKALAGFQAKSQFKSWLTTIIVRTCCDYWRKHSKVKELSFDNLTDEENGVDHLDNIQFQKANEIYKASLGLKEAKDLLDWALAHLSADDRMVLSLVHLEGLSVVEASQLLGWSVSNVKVKAHRARLKLRTILSGAKEGQINEQ